MQPTLENAGSESSAAATMFPLPAMLTMDTASETAEAIKQSPLLKSGMLMLDASKTELVTSAGIQLIVSTAKAAEQSGGLFLIVQPKAPLTQAFKDVGLGAWLTQREASHG